MASCTQDTLKIFGFTVGTLHLHLVLSIYHEDFEDLVALQTPKLIYGHGANPFVYNRLIFYTRNIAWWQTFSMVS